MPNGAGRSALAQYQKARRRRSVRLAAATLLIGMAVAEAIAGVRPVVVAATIGLSGLATLAALAGSSGRDIDRWRRGAAGELRTAELLADLPARRWTVWHDLRVPGSSANIDHLVVGRTGVWLVDTKTTRASIRAAWRSVRFGDRKLDVSATLWEAEKVADVISPVPVRPIVAVHGAGLRRRGATVSGVTVLPADQVVRRIRRGRRRLRRVERAEVCRSVERSFSRPGRA